MNTRPDILSIVIVSRNDRAHLCRCLDSLGCSGASGTEIVVVDNGSVQEAVAARGKTHPQIRLLVNAANAGACAARNQGIACSSGAWVLTLDSDCVLAPGALDIFLEAVRGIPERVGMVQPDILDGTGMRVWSRGICLSPLRRFSDLDRGRAASHACLCAERIIGPCSAAAFYRRSMLEDVRDEHGYFDERFFFLVEDVDLAWRARNRGWKTLYLPALRCFHAGNGSATGAKLRQYLCLRNRRLMLRKNEHGWTGLRTRVLSWPYEMSRLGLMALTNKYLWTQKTADWSLPLW